MQPIQTTAFSTLLFKQIRNIEIMEGGKFAQADGVALNGDQFTVIFMASALTDGDWLYHDKDTIDGSRLALFGRLQEDTEDGIPVFFTPLPPLSREDAQEAFLRLNGGFGILCQIADEVRS